MSNGQKKTGTRDLSDLKARLGMLNKSVGGSPRSNNPFSPQGGAQAPTPAESAPESAPDSTVDGDPGALEASTSLHDAVDFDSGNDSTQQVDIVSEAVAAQPAPAQPAPAQPAPVQPAPVQPAPAQPAPATGGFNPFGLGSDLFKKEEPAPEPPAPEPVAQAPIQQAPARQAPAQQAPAAQAPMAQAEQPVIPQPKATFANPLQMGSVTEAAPPVDLSAEDEAALAAFEKGAGRANKKVLLFTVIPALALGLGFGFMAGNVRGTRKLVNVQIDHARQVNEGMQKTLDQLDEMIVLVEKLDPDKIDWVQLELIPQDLASVAVGGVLGGRYLPQKLMTQLSSLLVSTNALFQDLTEHRQLTLVRDKAQLEAEAAGDTFAQNRNFAVVYSPPDPKKFRIPEGRLVAVVGKEDTEEGTRFKVQYQKGREGSVEASNIIALDRDEVVRGGGNNVKLLYSKRVKALRDQAQALMEPSKNLRAMLKQEAAREKVSELF